MANLAIEGKNVILRILKEGEYVPYACAISINYSRNRETIETSTVDSAGEAEFVYGFGSWGATINGVSHILPGTDTGITVFELLDRMNTKSAVDIEIAFEDEEGNLKTIRGRALVIHAEIDAGSEGFSEDSIELQGTGVVTIDTELIAPEENDSEVMKIEYPAVGGETTITDSALVGKTKEEILHVHRDANILEVIDVGTPTDRQVKLITGTGTLSFLTEFSAGEFILILYK